MNWDDKVCHAAQFVDHDPEVIGDAEYADGYVDGAVTGAKWQRDQLRTNEATERVARALNGAGWVCMGCEYEPYDFDQCESCRDVCLKQARAVIAALLGDN